MDVHLVNKLQLRSLSFVLTSELIKVSLPASSRQNFPSCGEEANSLIRTHLTPMNPKVSKQHASDIKNAIRKLLPV
jgi:hypothetical protein